MPLDILRKDVIDHDIVKKVIESPVSASHDKPIAKLFDVPLSHLPSPPASARTNFFGIDLSHEKYTNVPECLTKFIGENRKISEENNNKNPSEVNSSNGCLNTGIIADPLPDDPEIIFDSSENKNKYQQSTEESNKNVKEDEVVLKEGNDDVTVVVPPTTCSDAHVECEDYLSDIILLSPKLNSSENAIFASTPQSIHNLPKHIPSDGPHHRSIATYFQESGINLSPTTKNRPVTNKNRVVLPYNHTDERNNFSRINTIDQCPKVTHDEGVSLKDRPLETETLILPSVPPAIADGESDAKNSVKVNKFISPKRTPVKPILNRLPHSKRELFKVDAKTVATNNNIFENRVNKLEPMNCKKIPDSCQPKGTGSTTDKAVADCKQVTIKSDNIIRMDEKKSIQKTMHDSNMSIEEDPLSNSFLSMSIDDNDIKQAELCNSARKGDLVIISETNDTEEVEVAPTEELKSYKLPFVSLNPQENRDNNNNDWSYLKSLETDEERYRVVRSVWKNMRIPDPNVNFSCFTFFHKSKKSCSNGDVKKCDRKRQREEADDHMPKAKRCKLFNNVNFFRKTLTDTRRIVEANYRADHLMSSYQTENMLRGRFSEKMDQLQNAQWEVEAIHRFYKGLPNQTEHDQQIVENEQVNVNKLYEQFRKVYKWSGRAFTHAVRL